MLRFDTIEKNRDFVAWFTFPTLMFGFVWLYLWGMAQGFNTSYWITGLTIANFFVLLLIEQVLPRNTEMNLIHDSQSWNDACHGIMLSAGRPLAQTLGTLAVAALSRMHLSPLEQVWPAYWPFFAQCLLGLTVTTFMDYWVHRSFHLIDRLWWFHAIHHDTPQMHLLKSGRIHIGEELINATLKPLPLVFLGMPQDVVLLLAMWIIFDGNLVHANIHQRFPSWAHYFLPTVHLHNIHHMKDRKYQDSNFSGSTAIWDIVFGTFNHPDKSEFADMGIKDSPVPPRFIDQVLFPFKAQLKIPPHPYSENPSNASSTRSQ